MNRLMMGLWLMAAAGAQAQQPEEKVNQAPEAEVQTAPAESALKGSAGEEGGSEEVQNLKGSLEGLNESYLETKSTVDKLSKIKLSGYIQAQWQLADSVGIQSVAGGNFPSKSATAVGASQRFQVRRGRLKTTYETLTSRYVLQIDVIPAGVTLKDAYVTVMEPWLKTFSYTMGVFDRPFGFEISYSSSSRESPERARVYQTLFPGERDMGAKLEINPPQEMGFLQYLNFKGGVFTGMGPTTNEIDDEQDLIGRIGFTAPIYSINLALDGGFSAYLGKSASIADTVFATGTNASGVKTWVGSAGNMGGTVDRNIMGVDAQLYYDLPVLGGLSLRGEYLWGTHPSSRTSYSLFTGTPAPTPATPAPAAPMIADREVMGWYVTWVQNLGKRAQAIVKYDVFDPNTEVEADDVGVTGSNLAAADLALATLGLGAIYHWDENLKFVAYYDQVTNEKASSSVTTGGLVPWKSDLTDNVFTFRAQMKF